MTSYADKLNLEALPVRRRTRRPIQDRAPLKLRALQTDSRTQEIVRDLTQRILNGDLQRGELLPPERELASQLGVSRTVVREATKTLQSDGLVAIRHGVGTVVTGASSEPVQRAFNQSLHGEANALAKLYEVRVAIETEAVALAAQRRTLADLEKLKVLSAGMDIPSPTDPLALVEVDMAFHSAIAAATQNNAFVVVLEAATSILIPERRKSSKRGRSHQEVQTDHWQLIQMIEAGDSARAVRLMREHLQPPR